jgi:hypothetical protein
MFEYTGVEKVGGILLFTLYTAIEFCVINLLTVSLVYLCSIVLFGSICIDSSSVNYKGERFYFLENSDLCDKFIHIDLSVLGVVVFALIVFICFYFALKHLYVDESKECNPLLLPLETWGWLLITLSSIVYFAFRYHGIYIDLFERRMHCAVDNHIIIPISVSIAIVVPIIISVIKQKTIKGVFWNDDWFK